MADYEVTEIEADGVRVTTTEDGQTLEEKNPKILRVRRKPEKPELKEPSNG